MAKIKPFLKRNFIRSDFFTWKEFDEMLKKCPEDYIETIGPKGKKNPRGSKYINKYTFIISPCRELWDFSLIEKKIKKYKWFQEYIDLDEWDVHIYGCIKGKERSFRKHNDPSHTFIIQCEGKCKWIVDGLGENILSPGDMISIPYLCYHECIPLSKRLSLSIPFYIY